MTDIATRLRTFCLADATVAAAIGSRMSQGVAPEQLPVPYVWYSRASTEDLDTLDASPGEAPFSTSFDIEAISDELDEAQDIAAALKARLNKYRGAFADSSVKGIFVTDHNDDYYPRGLGADEGRHVAALRVEIIP